MDTWVKKEQEFLIALRRWFHMHPELSTREYEMAAKIEEELTWIGVTHRRIRETGVFVSIGGEKGSGKVLVLRAGTDALSMKDLLDKSYRSVNFGYAHARGHDAHTAVLLHAVKLLQERRHEFAGEIRFFFQPGEETDQGARTFIGEGCLDGVDRIFGVHMCSSLDVGIISLTSGPTNASCDHFRIAVQGKGARVSTPQEGADALYTAPQIVIDLQSIISRSLFPPGTAAVGIDTLHAGTQHNIVAKEALLEGTIHNFSSRTRAYINQRACEIVYQAASLCGGSVQAEFRDFAASLINDNQVIEELIPVVQVVAGKDRVIRNQGKVMQADGFADYLAYVPGCYAFIGSRNSQSCHTGMPHYHAQSDIDGDAMLLLLAIFVRYASQYLA